MGRITREEGRSSRQVESDRVLCCAVDNVWEVYTSRKGKATQGTKLIKKRKERSFRISARDEKLTASWRTTRPQKKRIRKEIPARPDA